MSKRLMSTLLNRLLADAADIAKNVGWNGNYFVKCSRQLEPTDTSDVLKSTMLPLEDDRPGVVMFLEEDHPNDFVMAAREAIDILQRTWEQQQKVEAEEDPSTENQEEQEREQQEREQQERQEREQQADEGEGQDDEEKKKEQEKEVEVYVQTNTPRNKHRLESAVYIVLARSGESAAVAKLSDVGADVLKKTEMKVLRNAALWWVCLLSTCLFAHLLFLY